MTNLHRDETQRIQEEQYDFPYHYIPQWDAAFNQARYWSWGFRYLGGIQIVLNELERLEFDSLIDIGCGDGRFLCELNNDYNSLDFVGIDKSQRAIKMANAMNPDIRYVEHNILEDGSFGQFEVATLIEVLEHIPPKELPEFLERVSSSISKNGAVIITVPHINKDVQPKHYQHFSSKQLRNMLEAEFDQIELIYFDDNSSLILKILNVFLAGQGEHFIVTNDFLTNAFWNLYLNKYLYTTENRCGRIAAVGRKIDS